MSLTRTVIFVGLVANMAACAGIQVPGGLRAETRAYHPYAVRTTVPPAQVLEAAERLAVEMYGDHVHMSLDRRRVVGYAANAGGRDRTEIAVTADGQLLVSVQTQLRDDHGRWQSSDVVCPRYAHARERGLAADVLHAAGYPEHAATALAYASRSDTP